MLLFVARTLLVAMLMISFNRGYILQATPLLELELEKEECKLLRTVEIVLQTEKKIPLKTKYHSPFHKKFSLKYSNSLKPFQKSFKKVKLYLAHQSLWL